uniref:TRUD domain-containing protein n=1 Tax=Clastoptera arizonana TaxID=38151 RepID=A0A1B6CNJ3_9HEMI
MMENENKTLSVLERFRQLQSQKQEDLNTLTETNKVSSMYLSSGTNVNHDDGKKNSTFNSAENNRKGNKYKRDHNQSEKHQGLVEKDIGISQYVTSGPGFIGIIKHRYSDFHVNEIDLEDNVVHLTSTELPIDESVGELSEGELSPSLTSEQLEALDNIYSTKEKEKRVEIDVSDISKEQRLAIHKEVKRRYGVEMDSNTETVDNKKILKICLSSKDKITRQATGSCKGDFLHFVVNKENTDTLEVIHILTQKLKIKQNNISHAGTKDKRAVTTQKMSIKKILAEKLKALSLWNVYLGNYEYKNKSLRLGDHNGNRFRIAIREINADDSTINNSINSIKEKGFLNYFGNQRFGCSVVAPTHVIGKAMLQSDWKEAVELILKPRPNERSYEDLTNARKIYWETKDAKKAFKCLRHYDKSIEGKILKGLVDNGANAYMNALERLPRNMLSMYSHAFQSLVWNKIVSRRVKEFGLVPLAGDLVYETNTCNIDNLDLEETMNSCEEDEKSKEHLANKGLKVRALTEEEARETKMFEIVYPTPGNDVTYPKNVIADWYEEILAENGIESESIKQNNRFFAWYGSYRKILNKPKDVLWKTVRYNEQNMDILISNRPGFTVEEPLFIAGRIRNNYSEMIKSL